MGIGATIGQLAAEKGINLRQLSKKAGISYNTLYAIVKRDSMRVTPETIQAVADALDTTWNEIVGFEDEDTAFEALQDEITDKMVGMSANGKLISVSKRSINQFFNLASIPETKEILQNLLTQFSHLNTTGQRIAAQRVEELSKIPEYRNDSGDSDAVPDSDKKTPAGE